jgi:hypothetical protein
VRFWTLGLAVALATHVVASSVACLLVAWWHRMGIRGSPARARGPREVLADTRPLPFAAGLVAAGLRGARVACLRTALDRRVARPRAPGSRPAGRRCRHPAQRLGGAGLGPHPAGRRPLPPQRPRDGRSAASGLACRPSLPGGGPRGRVAAAIAAVGAGDRSTEPGGAGRSPGARARASRRAGQPEAPPAGRVPRCSRPDQRGLPPALGVPRGRGGGRRRPCLRTGLSHRARARDPHGCPACPRGPGLEVAVASSITTAASPRVSTPWSGIARSFHERHSPRGLVRALWWPGHPGVAVGGALAGSHVLLAALHGALERLVHLFAQSAAPRSFAVCRNARRGLSDGCAKVFGCA